MSNKETEPKPKEIKVVLHFLLNYTTTYNLYQLLDFFSPLCMSSTVHIFLSILVFKFVFIVKIVKYFVIMLLLQIFN